jgi:glycerate-2-kinase
MRRIINRESLTGHGNIKGRTILLDIIEKGMSAADPYMNTKRLVEIKDNKLIFDGVVFEAEGDPRTGPKIFDLQKDIDRIYIIGIGKGIQRITKALEDILGDYLTGGHVLGKHGDEVIMEKIGVTLGGHPTPDIYCVEGCKRIEEIIKEADLTERDLVITAMGNGIGSLCSYPVEGIPIEDVTEMVRLMQIEYGMPTADLCFIRNNIDRFKGGKLSRMLRPAQMVHLLGIPPKIVNTPNFDLSGYDALTKRNLWSHTLCDNTSPEEALDIIGIWDTKRKCPTSITDYLNNYNQKYITVKPDEYESWNCRVFGLMPYSLAALPAAMKRAEELGYTPYLLTDDLRCEASSAGAVVAQIAISTEKGITPFKPPCAIFSGGEVIVTCGDNPGVGGRNQELTVSGAIAITNSKRIVMAAVDTDGTDGPGGEFHDEATARGITVLSGGIVDGYTLASANNAGVDLADALRTHSTSKALWTIDSGIAATQNISITDLQCTIVMDSDG